jgi:prepilin peptidase CpaA
MALDLVRLLLFPALMAFAAVSDLFTMTISNRISLLLIAGFVVLAAFGGLSLYAVSMHVAAGLAVLTITFGCFAAGWIGGGDAKLAAATALWLGFDHLLLYLVYAAFTGGALALVLLSLRNWALPVVLLGQEWAHRLQDTKRGIPYGIALAIAALVIYPETEWVKAVDLGRFAIG